MSNPLTNNPDSSMTKEDLEPMEEFGSRYANPDLDMKIRITAYQDAMYAIVLEPDSEEHSELASAWLGGVLRHCDLEKGQRMLDAFVSDYQGLIAARKEESRIDEEIHGQVVFHPLDEEPINGTRVMYSSFDEMLADIDPYDNGLN